MRELFAVLERVAPADATVLLQGETGTGKELVARAIHEASAAAQGALRRGGLRRARPRGWWRASCSATCAAPSPGRDGARAAPSCAAHGGTLFLDELGELRRPCRPSCCACWRSARCARVGGDAEQRGGRARGGGRARATRRARWPRARFRPDLYYRLAVVRVRAAAAARAARGHAAARRGAAAPPRPRARRRARRPRRWSCCRGHDWPGNVRELRNVLERALALSRGRARFEELRLVPAAAGAEPELPLRTDLPFAEAKQAVIDALRAPLPAGRAGARRTATSRRRRGRPEWIASTCAPWRGATDCCRRADEAKLSGALSQSVR